MTCKYRIDCEKNCWFLGIAGSFHVITRINFPQNIRSYNRILKCLHI